MQDTCDNASKAGIKLDQEQSPMDRGAPCTVVGIFMMLKSMGIDDCIARRQSGLIWHDVSE